MFLFVGTERALLIDTGTCLFDIPATLGQLTDKPVDVALTHGHVDHAGGIGWFETPEAPISHYETRVRFDARAKGFADAVREAVAWIEKTAGIVPCRVPDAACDPLYSSWYNFHQDVFAADIESELAIAAKLGMKTFILDDGWQMEDTSRGYAFCGDWQVER